MKSTDVVNRLWSLAGRLRHAGIGYGDYVEELTYLLFIRMADERGLPLPSACNWDSIMAAGPQPELVKRYNTALSALGQGDSPVAAMFHDAKSLLADPTTLFSIMSSLEQTHWTTLDVDVKAAAFEGLLERAASEGKKGAGQYFTPRELVECIVRCMAPDPRANDRFALTDPACGAGGFLLSAHDWFKSSSGAASVIDPQLSQRVSHSTYFGQELVAQPRRLAMMNMWLRGIEPNVTLQDSIYGPLTEARYDVVLTNPPFGSKGGREVPQRPDFWVKTTDKQLNFVQHVVSILKEHGRAAIVVSDGALFSAQAQAVFRHLVEICDLHTVLRLPIGSFSPYASGVRTNVVFFTKGQATSDVWIYDARSEVASVTFKNRPLERGHFAEFESCYGADPNGRANRSCADAASGRWRGFTRADLEKSDFDLASPRWIPTGGRATDNTAAPVELAVRAIGELETAIDELTALIDLVQGVQPAAGSRTDEATVSSDRATVSSAR